MNFRRRRGGRPAGLDRSPLCLERGLGARPRAPLDDAEDREVLPWIGDVAEGLTADDGPLHLAPGLVELAELLK